MEQLESPSFTLSPIETASPLWLKIKSHLETRLRELRAQNDGMMPEDRRNLTIGRISEVKALLQAAEPS